jgi:uncharacterized metal-binding protein
MAETTKVGIIACSGEEIPAGTISRLATRRVLELLRPQSTVTLCLPLFLAGEEQERRFAQQHPTITVDGCDKLCAKRGTEQYSGQVAASLVVTEILGDRVEKCHRSARQFDQSDEEAVWTIAKRIAAGTISRLATRRVLELLRPQSTVTLCLPLFLAGEEQERRFARQHPTITVDGCDKLCAKRGTEQYSGQVATSLVVADILGPHIEKCHRSARAFDQADEQAVWTVAERIAAEVDALSTTVSQPAPVAAPQNTPCGCACGSRPVEGNLRVNGRTVTVPALPMVFDHLHRQGLPAGSGSTDQLLEMVRIYHAIEPDDEHLYREALTNAYAEYCRSRAKSLVEIN